mmetsp:Transcript_112832/g.195887  ORF Transcript_112832/g.195887 Transcript_112832/m.195887 type:complete len:139 (-) Transcript_112832:470-886(-)
MGSEIYKRLVGPGRHTLDLDPSNETPGGGALGLLEYRPGTAPDMLGTTRSTLGITPCILGVPPMGAREGPQGTGGRSWRTRQRGCADSPGATPTVGRVGATFCLNPNTQGGPTLLPPPSVPHWHMVLWHSQPQTQSVV